VDGGGFLTFPNLMSGSEHLGSTSAQSRFGGAVDSLVRGSAVGLLATYGWRIGSSKGVTGESRFQHLEIGALEAV